MTTAPKRAYTLTMEIGADSLEALIDELYFTAFQLHTGSTNSTGGGPSSGGSWQLTHDPHMTHDLYFELVHAYLKELDAQKPRCVRCGAILNNLSPGFSVTANGQMVCANCLQSGEEIARAR